MTRHAGSRKHADVFEAFHLNQRERRDVVTNLIFSARKRVIYIDGRLSWFIHARQERYADFVALLKAVRFECYYMRGTPSVMRLYRILGDSRHVPEHRPELRQAFRVIGNFNQIARNRFELTENPIAVYPYDFPPLFPAVWVDPESSSRSKLFVGVRLFGRDLQDSPSILTRSGQPLYREVASAFRLFRDRYKRE